MINNILILILFYRDVRRERDREREREEREGTECQGTRRLEKEGENEESVRELKD